MKKIDGFTFIRRGIDRVAGTRDLVSRMISLWPPPFRLMLMSVGVGIVAGLGAIFFDWLLAVTLDLLIRPHTGYGEPGRGAAAAAVAAMESVHSGWFFLLPALGGLVSGAIV